MVVFVCRYLVRDPYLYICQLNCRYLMKLPFKYVSCPGSLLVVFVRRYLPVWTGATLRSLPRFGFSYGISTEFPWTVRA
jgi:hypothetical protein